MIPKKIHYCWVGGNPLSELAKKCIESWKKYCPDYEIIEWNESNYDFTQNQYMKEAYNSRKWGFVPDYARLDIIYREGGFYFDTDVELLKPLDELLSLDAFCGMEKPGRINFGQGFGAAPHCEIIREMMTIYNDKEFINDYEFLSEHTDPFYMTEFLRTKGLLENNTQQKIDDMTIFPTDYLCPKDMITGIENYTQNTISIHHYDGTWAPSEVRDYNNYKWNVFNRYGKVFGLFPWAIYVIRVFGFRELLQKIKRHL